MSIKSNWKKCKLKDLVKINSSSVSKKDNLNHIVYLDTGNITMGKIEELAEFAYSEAPSRAKRKVKENSIVYSMVRPNQRHYGLIKNPTTNLIVSTGFAVLDAKEFADSKYIYYWLTQNHITDLLQGIAENSTSAYPAIRPVDLENLDISLPPLEEQKRSAEILGSLDDKIELLQKQNKTLEDMAKALFKSWFVDFDVVRAKQKGLPKADIMREYHLTEELYDLFPSSFADSPLGPIPFGWQVKKIGELVSVVRGGSPRPIQKFLSKEGLPWLKISDATASPTKFITHIEQCIIPEGLSKTRFIKKGSLVVSNSATPGMPKFLALDTCIHDGWLFLDDYKGITKELLYYFILFNRAELVALGSGSVFTNLKTDVLKNFQIVVPTGIIQNKLNPIFAQIDEAILLHNKQIQTLTELRDTLLPRLISGKIRV